MVESNPRPDLPLSARLRQDLKNDLIAGLLVVIPLATTIWLSTIVSRFVLAFLTSIPKQFNPFITLNPLLQDLINLALGLTVPLMGILLIGLMARNIVGRWLLEFGEGTLSRIPLAGSVYKTLKQHQIPVPQYVVISETPNRDEGEYAWDEVVEVEDALALKSGEILLRRPFVEKPASAEDHDIFVFFHAFPHP